MIMSTVQNSATLGQMIRAERKRQRLTQEQLAGVSGVGVRFVRELENGKESCHLGLALTVMNTLGLALSVTGRGKA
jgi:y4mF family transcriptional regulator